MSEDGLISKKRLDECYLKVLYDFGCCPMITKVYHIKCIGKFICSCGRYWISNFVWYTVEMSKVGINVTKYWYQRCDQCDEQTYAYLQYRDYFRLAFRAVSQYKRDCPESVVACEWCYYGRGSCDEPVAEEQAGWSEDGKRRRRRERRGEPHRVDKCEMCLRLLPTTGVRGCWLQSNVTTFKLVEGGGGGESEVTLPS